MLCTPSGSTGLVNDQPKLGDVPLSVAVPNSVGPSKTSTRSSWASTIVPANDGVLSLVTLSIAELPVSLASGQPTATTEHRSGSGGAIGASVSIRTTNGADGGLVFCARSVAVAV